MERQKRERLGAAGWKIGGAEEFLSLDAEEAAFVDLRLSLADAVKAERLRRRLTQAQLAKLLKSSQSRIAKIEAAEASVSIDLMVRSLLRMGASRRQLASCITPRKRKRAA